MPKVSVIMPVYNTEKYLPQAIESILNQDFSDFEFIILDDCSKDKSFEICQLYVQKDKRIKLFKNKENKWISFCRNKLISLAETNLICSQDSDDISALNRISLLYNFLEKRPEFAVCSGNLEIIDENDKILWFRKYSQNIEKIILKKSPIANWASIFRKSAFLEVWGYDKNLDFAEDYDLWLKFFSKWYKIWVLQNFLSKHRIRTWQTKSKNLKQTLKNTIFVQKRAKNIYKIKASFSDYIHYFLLNIFLIFPSIFIIFLFKKLEYKNDKR